VFNLILQSAIKFLHKEVSTLQDLLNFLIAVAANIVSELISDALKKLYEDRLQNRHNQRNIKHPKLKKRKSRKKTAQMPVAAFNS